MRFFGIVSLKGSRSTVGKRHVIYMVLRKMLEKENKMLTEREKKCFESHEATLSDYGTIKVLDFKRPDSSYYRIRFLFEEDYCRLHISGDLGSLTAANYTNMTYEKFAEDYVGNPSYFREKVECHNRPFFVFDENMAKASLKEYLDESGVLAEVLRDGRMDWETDDDKLNDFFEDVFSDFTDTQGIGSAGYEALERYFSDPWEFASSLGKQETNILELYLYAFQMAKAQIDQEKNPSKKE